MSDSQGPSQSRIDAVLDAARSRQWGELSDVDPDMAKFVRSSANEAMMTDEVRDFIARILRECVEVWVDFSSVTSNDQVTIAGQSVTIDFRDDLEAWLIVSRHNAQSQLRCQAVFRTGRFQTLAIIGPPRAGERPHMQHWARPKAS